MSYALTNGLGQVDPTRVSVGAAARHDIVLANASLVASKILLQAAKKPADVRSVFISNKLNAMQSGLARAVLKTQRRLVSQGKSFDQAMFDAMRLAIANLRMSDGIESLVAASVAEHGAEAFAGTGLGAFSPGDRQTACSITSGAQVVGGVASIIPVYGTIVGGVVGIGAAIAGGSLDCTREQREAAAAAAAAQANLAAAQQAAAMNAETIQATARRNRMRTYMIGGGSLVVVLGIGYFLLS